jgi:carbon monoxide dehydrogenase subunit G
MVQVRPGIDDWRSRVETKTTIAAPADVVWRTLSDIERWPSWLPTVDDAAWMGDKGLLVGHRARLVQPRLGTAVWTVTEVEGGMSFTWTRRAPGVLTTGEHHLTEDRDGTAVMLGIQHSGPLAWLARLLTDKITRRYIDTEARALKAECETRHGPTAT